MAEQIRYNLLYRWFIGLAIDDDVSDHSSFSKNRDRLLEHAVIESFFTEVMALADKGGLLSKEHFSVDGTGAGHMVEDEQALLVIENRVVVRQAPVIAHVVEGLQHGDAGLQDAFRHERFKQPGVAQALHVLAEDAVQRLVAIDLDTAMRAHGAQILDDEGVQPIQGGFRLVLFDRFAHVLRHCLEIALVGRGREGIKLCHRCIPQYALAQRPAVFEGWPGFAIFSPKSELTHCQITGF